MTFEQCHANLLQIRRRQGTRCPAVRVAYNGTVYQGRLTRADSDPEYRRKVDESPFGVIVRGTAVAERIARATAFAPMLPVALRTVSPAAIVHEYEPCAAAVASHVQSTS